MMRRILIVALAALAVAGCGRKDAQQQAQQQQQSSPFVQDNAQPAQQQQASSGDGSGSLSSCPASLPSRDVVAKSIKDALSAIYGPDETGTKVSVSTMTPSSDCSSVAVAYKSSGTPGSTTMSHDGDTWSLTLYNKQYPVK